MKKINLKAILIPTIALFLICAIATTCLALTNQLTIDKIAQNAIETEQASRKVVLETASSFSDNNSIDDSDIIYSVGTDDGGDTVGYVFTSVMSGYGGDVSVMIGIDMSGVITGVEILSHSETPGLGANATKDAFKDQFKCKSGALVVNKVNSDGQNIQAITAATITSTAVVNAVNNATIEFEKLIGGEDNG